MNREKIFYWITLLLGLVILIAQVVRYILSDLEFVFGELVVFAIGLLLAGKPKALTEFVFKSVQEKSK